MKRKLFLVMLVIAVIVMSGCTKTTTTSTTQSTAVKATTQATTTASTSAAAPAPASTSASAATTAAKPPAPPAAATSGAPPSAPPPAPAATSAPSNVDPLTGLPAGLGRAPGASKTELLFWDKTKAYNGYTLFASGGAWLIDMEGNVVNKWTSGTNPQLLPNGNIIDVAGGGPENSGNFKEMDWDSKTVWSYSETRKGYSPHHDWRKIYNPKLKQDTFIYIANKNITQDEAIALGADPKTGPYTNGQMDVLTEVDMKGNIIWEWRFVDHIIQDFDPTKANYVGQGKTIADYPGRLNINQPGRPLRGDWLHCNSMDYNQDLDQLVTNSVQGEFYVIDHGNTFVPGDPEASFKLAAGPKGDFLYRFGDPARYNQGKPPSVLLDWTNSSSGNKQLGGSHDIQWIKKGLPGEGNFLVFSNSQYLFERIYQSYVYEINPRLDKDKKDTGKYVNPPDAGYYALPVPNEKDTHKQPRQISNQIVWMYGSKTASDFASHIGSGAQRLPNGNTLICADTVGHFFEIDSKGMVVWDYINPIYKDLGALKFRPDVVPMVNGVFRAYRYAPDYAGLKGKTLTSKGPITAIYQAPAGGGAQPKPAAPPAPGGAQPPPPGGAQPPPPGGAQPPPPAASSGSTAPNPAPKSTGTMKLTSSVVKEGGEMPEKYTRQGAKNGLTTVSPPIAWTGAPAGTQSFAVIGWNGVIFWALYNIPGTSTSLPEDVKGVGTELQKFITPSEGGPGTFPKHITLYALSANVTVPAGGDVEALRKALNAVTLDSATLNYNMTVQ